MEEDNEERRERHTQLNLQEMMGVRQLSLQSARMKEEQRQTAILEYTTQDYAIKSQFDSTRQLALIACPVYDQEDVHWKAVQDLMNAQNDLVKKK